jgi:acyl-CoA synthetase (AMP-forming)/AMP-acid ligase II
MLGAVLDSCERQGGRLRHLRVVSGVESLETIQRLQSMLPHARFWSAYGQTETSGTISLSPFDQRPGSAGRPMPLCSVGIVNEVGETVGPGTVGEIMVRGPGVSRGYWPLGDTWSPADHDSWHRTGDLGSLDQDGYLWFRGRSEAKDLIKTGGENVYPAEVERVLKSHPALADAAVLGVPDRTWGEAVKAVCVLRPGASVTTDEIIDYVASRLARFKRPKVVEFIDQVPRTASGRLDKSALQ